MGGRMDAPPPRNGMMDRGASPVNTPSPLRVGPQLGLPGRWWDDKKTVKHLNLRTDQQRRMDDIFNSNKGTLVGLLSNLQREQTRLSSLSPQELQDETKVFAAIDRVEVARAELEKENARILMQIRQQLDPTQLSALDQDIASFR
jgi:Spy/CpxP family protein refolding chaperone